MILKFDHVSFVIKYSDFERTDLNLKNFGYKMKFSENRKPNLSIKQNYFTFNQDSHDLYYYEHLTKLPVEVIAYSDITNSNQPFLVDLENDCFQIHSSNLDLFKVIFKKDMASPEFEKTINIKGILDKNPIVLEQSEAMIGEVSWNLDNAGYCCPTFMVNNIDKYKKHFENNDLKCSEINKICINGNDLSVFFVEGKNKELVEIIAYS